MSVPWHTRTQTHTHIYSLSWRKICTNTSLKHPLCLYKEVYKSYWQNQIIIAKAKWMENTFFPGCNYDDVRHARVFEPLFTSSRLVRNNFSYAERERKTSFTIIRGNIHIASSRFSLERFSRLLIRRFMRSDCIVLCIACCRHTADAQLKLEGANRQQ